MITQFLFLGERSLEGNTVRALQTTITLLPSVLSSHYYANEGINCYRLWLINQVISK